MSVQQLSPLVTKVSAHLSWSANVIKYLPTDLPYSTGDHVAASISFKVKDPHLLGYNVEYFGYTRGFYTGKMTNVAPDPNEWVGDIWMKPSHLRSEASTGPFDDLYGSWAEVNQGYPIANVSAGSSTPPAILGQYDQFGKQEFGVTIRSHFGFRSEFDPLMTGETAARFGLEPTYDGFSLGSYQNAIDGESAASHGLFLNFTITALSAKSVPDKVNVAATLLVTLAAMLLTARVAGRKRQPA